MLPFQVASDSICVTPVVTVISVVSAGPFVASGAQHLHTEGQGGSKTEDLAKYNRAVNKLFCKSKHSQLVFVIFFFLNVWFNKLPRSVDLLS